MRVVITGGGGFLGGRLEGALLDRGRLSTRTGEAAIERVVLVDVTFADTPAGPRVERVEGDISHPAGGRGAVDGDTTAGVPLAAVVARVIDANTTAVFHLAAIVSGMAEADFDLGMRINLDAMRLLLERCRSLGHCPRFVFTSSVAVYGGELPETVLETTAVQPQT